MVDALDARALVRRIALQHRGRLVHLEIEVERHAEGVGGAQRAALERHLGKRDRQVAGAKPGGGAVDVVLARQLESERRDGRLARPAQHDRVVIALLHAAQMQRVRALVGGEQAEAVDVERAAAGEIAHAELDMARPHDVERRRELGRAGGHAP
jgi:hypothetical protein